VNEIWTAISDSGSIAAEEATSPTGLSLLCAATSRRTKKKV